MTVAEFPAAITDGDTDNETSVTTEGAGKTVTEATWLVAYPAPMATVVDVVTVPVGTAKLMLVWPAGIRYAACAGNADGLPLDTDTSAPPEGAGSLKVSVSVAIPPAITCAGVT